ncbi:MAG: hypothetical protein ACR2QE_12040, partial [Acidimicrobiales bacterium]
RCEATACTLHTGQMQSDGTISAITEITIPPQLDDAPDVRDLAWGDDGTLYVVVTESLYAVNTVDQTAESLGIGAQLVEPYPDGPFASATRDRITIGPSLDPLLERPGTSAVAVADDGERLGVVADAGNGSLVAILEADDGAVATAAATSAPGGLAWAPNGRTLFYWGEAGTGFLTTGESEGSASGSSEFDRTTAARFSPDGTALAYSTGDTGPTATVAIFAEQTVAAVTPAVDFTRITSRTELGLGAVAGWTLDGSGVLVVTDAPGDQLGAEGESLLTVWVRPLDGSDAYPAFDDDRTIETGGADFAFGRNGDIAWAEWCDGVTCRIALGQQQANGTIAAITEIPVPDTGGEPPVITDLEWGANGTLYFAMNGTAYMVNIVDQVAESLGGENVRLLTPTVDGFSTIQDGSDLTGSFGDEDTVSIEVGPLSWSGTGLGQATATTTAATTTEIDVVPVGRYDGGSSTTTGTVNGLTWAPAGDTVVWYGGDGLGAFTVQADGASESILLPRGSLVLDATFSPDGTALAITTLDEGIPDGAVLFFGAIASPSSPAAPIPVPVGLIDGMVMGLLDDNNALVLRDDFEATEAFCNGDGPAQSLWQVPLDQSEPTLLALDQSEPTLLAPGLAGPALYYRSPGDRLAYISGCDVFDTLSVEDLADDNNELLTVNVRDIPSTAGAVQGLQEVDWLDDNLLLLTGWVESGEGRAWRVQIETGAVEELVDLNGNAYTDVVDVAIGLQGELLLVGTDYFASVDDPTPLDGEAVGGLSMNGPIAYNRPGELWRLGLDEPYADFEAGNLFVSRDGSHVVALEQDQDGLRLLEIELEGTFLTENRSWPVVDADGGRGFFTTDSARFVYSARVENSRGGDADGFEVRMLDFGAGAGPESVPTESEQAPTTAVTAPPATAIPAAAGPTGTCTPQTPPPLGSDDTSIPAAVFDTQQAIAIAAATCDYTTLAEIAGDDIFLGFQLAPGTDPLTYWTENDAQFEGSFAESYVDVITGRTAPVVGEDGATRWLWPAVAAYDSVEEIPADVLADHLAHTGITQEVFEIDWDLLGIYPLLTISIHEDGTWVAAAPAE